MYYNNKFGGSSGEGVSGTASDISYSNSLSLLDANNVQAAIDEIADDSKGYVTGAPAAEDQTIPKFSGTSGKLLAASTLKVNSDTLELKNTTGANAPSDYVGLYANQNKLFMIDSFGVSTELGSSSSVGSTWSFSNVTNPTGITDGQVRLNNATISNATEIYIHVNSSEGNSARPILELAGNGDTIFLCNSDESVCMLYRISASTDNTTYFTFTVTFSSGTGSQTFIDGEVLTGRLHVSGNPFDQLLNTNNDVQFASVSTKAGSTNNHIEFLKSTNDQVSASFNLQNSQNDLRLNCTNNYVHDVANNYSLNVSNNGTFNVSGQMDIASDGQLRLIGRGPTNTVKINTGSSTKFEFVDNSLVIKNLGQGIDFKNDTTHSNNDILDVRDIQINRDINLLNSTAHIQHQGIDKLELTAGLCKLFAGWQIDSLNIGAGINMNNTKVVNLAQGTLTGDAVNKGQLDSSISNVNTDISALQDKTQHITATQTDTNFTSNINMGGNAINNVAGIVSGSININDIYGQSGAINLFAPFLVNDYIQSSSYFSGTEFNTGFLGAVMTPSNIDMRNTPIINVQDPVNNQDAVTKNYVDTEVNDVQVQIDDLKLQAQNLDGSGVYNFSQIGSVLSTDNLDYVTGINNRVYPITGPKYRNTLKIPATGVTDLYEDDFIKLVYNRSSKQPMLQNKSGTTRFYHVNFKKTGLNTDALGVSTGVFGTTNVNMDISYTASLSSVFYFYLTTGQTNPNVRDQRFNAIDYGTVYDIMLLPEDTAVNGYKIKLMVPETTSPNLADFFTHVYVDVITPDPSATFGLPSAPTAAPQIVTMQDKVTELENRIAQLESMISSGGSNAVQVNGALVVTDQSP